MNSVEQIHSNFNKFKKSNSKNSINSNQNTKNNVTMNLNVSFVKIKNIGEA
jgi:hypothetical protein